MRPVKCNLRRCCVMRVLSTSGPGQNGYPEFLVETRLDFSITKTKYRADDSYWTRDLAFNATEPTHSLRLRALASKVQQTTVREFRDRLLRELERHVQYGSQRLLCGVVYLHAVDLAVN